jgi:trehalose-6-phosphatase
MPTIAIDFDNTLTEESGDPFQVGGETPNGDVIEDVQRLKENEHYTIIIWTARPWSHAQQIAGLCVLWGVPFNGIRCDKGGADAYLDDKSVTYDGGEWLDEATTKAEAGHG